MLKADFRSDFTLKAKLIPESLELVEVGLSDLDLKLVACSKLVLDVL